MRNIIDEIQLNYENLSKSEKRIASYVMNNKIETSQANIKDFAKQVNVSIATITRFCKKINCQSFMEFKLLLKDSFQCIDEGENIINSTEQLYSSIIASSHSLVNIEDVEKAAEWITSSHNIQLYGIGSSGLSAEEFQLRLRRMNLLADTNLDSHTMLMSASIVSSSDLVIAISNSGQTKEVLEAVQLAKEQHAKVIAITNHDNTHLSKLSDLTLFTASYKIYAANNFINSQLSIMFIIDILSRLLMENPDVFTKYQLTLKALNEHKKI